MQTNKWYFVNNEYENKLYEDQLQAFKQEKESRRKWGTFVRGGKQKIYITNKLTN